MGKVKCLNCKQILTEGENCTCGSNDYKKLSKMAEITWQNIEKELQSYFE